MIFTCFRIIDYARGLRKTRLRGGILSRCCEPYTLVNKNYTLLLPHVFIDEFGMRL